LAGFGSAQPAASPRLCLSCDIIREISGGFDSAQPAATTCCDEAPQAHKKIRCREAADHPLTTLYESYSQPPISVLARFFLPRQSRCVLQEQINPAISKAIRAKERYLAAFIVL